MSVILRPRATSHQMHVMGIRPRAGRGFAMMFASGAIVFALALAATIPVRAERALATLNPADAAQGYLDH